MTALLPVNVFEWILTVLSLAFIALGLTAHWKTRRKPGVGGETDVSG